MTEDELVELTELRRRAYGPDADIADDPEARTRLRELEAAARREHLGETLELPPVQVAHPRPLGPRPVGPRALDPVSPDPAQPDPESPGPEPPARRQPGRRSSWVVAAAAAAAAGNVIAGAQWPRPVAAPAAPPSSPAVSTAVDVTCGSGWGPHAAGRLTPPRQSDVVWSPLWNPTPDRGPTIVLFTGVGQWLGQLTPVYVPGGVASVVQVLAPASARIVTFADSRASGGSLTASDYPDSAAMVAAGRRLVPLPPCQDADTYPLLVIAPDDACVQLEVTLAEGPVYGATVDVGSGTCPRS
jgi:hypothetical protein